MADILEPVSYLPLPVPAGGVCRVPNKPAEVDTRDLVIHLHPC